MKKSLKKTLIITFVMVVLYIILFYFFDKSIDLWIHENLSGTLIASVGKYLSFLANPHYNMLVMFFCFGYIFVVDPSIEKASTKKLLYVLIVVSIAIIIGSGLKYLLGRYRPVMLFDHNLYGFHFFAAEWALNSTPSGHTIRAFSFFTALSLLFRQYKIIFVSIAIVIGLSRVVVTAHYPSDILFGAFIGIMVAIWVYNYFIKVHSIKI